MVGSSVVEESPSPEPEPSNAKGTTAAIVVVDVLQMKLDKKK